MPNSFLDLKTEVDYFSDVLIIDEQGEISSQLVDALLNHGCQIYYLGINKKDDFYYLEGKSNFVYLNTISEVDALEKINYFFYFPAEIKEKSRENEPIFSITGKFSCRTLICSSVYFSEAKRLQGLIKDKSLNARLVVYDALYGPRIIRGVLGNLFRLAIWEKQAILSESPDRKISPVYSEIIVREIIRIIFSSDTKAKAYFIGEKEILLKDFTLKIQKVFPDFSLALLGKTSEEKIEDGSWEKLEVSSEHEENIEKTVNWFVRNIPQMATQEEIMSSSKLFETEVQPEVVEMTQQEVVVKEEPSLTRVEEREEPEKKVDFIFQKEEQNPAETKRKPVKAPKVKTRKTPGRRFFLGISLFVILTIISFILPILLTVVFEGLGIYSLQNTKNAIDNGNFSLAIKSSERGEKLFSSSSKILFTVAPFYGLVGLDKGIGILNETITFSQNINESFKFSLLATQGLFNWGGDFINGKGSENNELFSSAKANLAFAYERASLALVSLPKIEKGFRLLNQSQLFEKIKEYLPQAREILLKSQNFVGVLPKIINSTGKKTYLVLFENNAEIRPTGGFIGSFAILNIENGRLQDFQVYDVYQADGQLKGHVEPPAKLKEYLGEATWYLRDSNWDPDFSISAKRAQWFLDKELQISVDGTFAVTLEAARKIVEAVGEVNIPEYQEKITKDNLFQKAEYYAELATFPGSSQKKDFLGSLSQSLFEKIKNAKGKELINIGGAFFTSLEQKEILLSFDEPELQKVVSGLNWDGGIRDYRPASLAQPAFSDYLYINEANVGINKANYFVKRKINHQISLADSGKIEEKLTIFYDNQSPSENWPAGRYKNYLRLYLPEKTRITSVLMTDPQNPGLWVPFDFKLFDSSEKNGKSIFGFLIEVPYKSQKTVEIKYEIDGSVDLSKKLNSYLLMVQKQPGGYASDYSLDFIYPAGFVPLRVIPSAVVGDGQLLIKSKLEKDLIFQIDLAH